MFSIAFLFLEIRITKAFLAVPTDRPKTFLNCLSDFIFLYVFLCVCVCHVFVYICYVFSNIFLYLIGQNTRGTVID